MNLKNRIWQGSVFLIAVAVSVSACGDDDTTQPPGVAGMAGKGGTSSTAGQAGSAHAGASAGDGGNGGSGAQGGQAGEASCVGGLRVVKVVQKSTDDIISWPAEGRVGVHVSGEGVLLYETSDDGEVKLIDTLGPEDLGLTADGSIYSLTRFGEGFLVQGSTGAQPIERRIVNWQPGAELETIPYPEPLPASLSITTADPNVGIAAATADGVRLATLESGTWSWSEPFDQGATTSTPLALEEDRVLVGVEEADRLGVGGAGNEGGAAAGGAGGETGGIDLPINPRAARIEWWNLQGERLATQEAYGNPHVAVRVSEGWLIGETNSFWGSYQAGIELLSDSGDLRKLAGVPVISAGDGTDGAVDLALLGSQLLVANCESGLRVGDWATDSVTLSSLPGPWQSGATGNCSPSQVETLDDFAVIGGDTIVFARACE